MNKLQQLMPFLTISLALALILSWLYFGSQSKKELHDMYEVGAMQGARACRILINRQQKITGEEVVRLADSLWIAEGFNNRLPLFK